jgi:hypothetical protein
MRDSVYLLIIALALLPLMCSKDKIAGTVSDTDSGKSAMVYNPDFTPAKGAKVRFFAMDDTTRSPVSQTETDTNGRYSYKGLAKGMYNIIANNDSLLSYQDSVYITPDTAFIHPDTLGKPGSVTAIVGLQPNHDPRTVTVQGLGTNVFCNVDSNGRFTLAPLARGTYNLRIVTTLPDYSARYKTITATSAKNDTLNDTIFLPYTGIPVVLGMKASYDTVNGLVCLSWNKTSYRDFQTYVIYRDAFESIVSLPDPIAARSDTLFIDTIFKRQSVSGRFSFSDTNDYHYKYRIAIENNANDIGKTYKNFDIIAASPTKVKTSFNFSIYHLSKVFFTDSASINDTLQYAVQMNNPNRALKSLTWKDLSNNTIIRLKDLDTTSKNAMDTMKYSWGELGEKGLECAITDIAGSHWKDTVYVSIVKDIPNVRISVSFAEVFAGDSIKLSAIVSDCFAKIVKYEWAIGDTNSFFETKKTDTSFFAPDTPVNKFYCAIRVTNDDGNMQINTITLKISLKVTYAQILGIDSTFPLIQNQRNIIVFNNKVWAVGGWANNREHNCVWNSDDGITWTKIIDSAAFSPRYFHTAIVFNNKIWVIGGKGLIASSTGSYRYNDVWSSVDGLSWKQEIDSAAFAPRYDFGMVVFNNKMWVIGGGYAEYNDIWSSPDGINWTLISNNVPALPKHLNSTIVFNDKIWIIAGDKSLDYPSSEIWNSSDGITWTQIASKAAFPDRCGHSTIVFNNKMWIIGGTNGYMGAIYKDIWNSKDGISWEQIPTPSTIMENLIGPIWVFHDQVWTIDRTGGLWHLK